GEDGKFLGPVRLAAIKGQPARRDAVTLALAQQPKVAGPQKGPQLVPTILHIEPIQKLETGEACFGRDLVGNLEAAIIEIVLVERDRLGMGQRELEDVHRLLIKVARMKKLDLEWQVV